MPLAARTGSILDGSLLWTGSTGAATGDRPIKGDGRLDTLDHITETIVKIQLVTR
jgi:hypothetical protein